MESSFTLLLLCGFVSFASTQFGIHAPPSRLFSPDYSAEEEYVDELLRLNESEVLYLKKNAPETVKLAMDVSKKSAAYCRHFCEIMSSFTPFLNESPIIREEILHVFMKRLFKESVKVTEYCNPVVRFMEMVIRTAEPIKSAYLKYEDKTSCFPKRDITTPASNPTSDFEPDPVDSDSETVSELLHFNEHQNVPNEDTQVDRSGDIEAWSHDEILDKMLLKSAMKETKTFPDQETDEIIAEEEEYPLIGSIRGIPGEHYPNYTDVPITSFSCADKNVQGFYADLETGCQVFHVCYEHRRESFLCPLGTIFNQPILACDYWYSSNCSLAPMYFDVNVETLYDAELPLVKDFIPSSGVKELEEIFDNDSTHKADFESLVKLLPVKAKISVFENDFGLASGVFEIISSESQDVDATADDIFNKLLMTTDVVSKTRDVIEDIPAPIPKPLPIEMDNFINILSHNMKLAPHSLVKPKLAAKIPLVAAKATLPMSAKLAAKVPLVAAKATLPMSAKLAAKVPLVAAKATLPMSPKLAAKVPLVAAKATLPMSAKLAAKVPHAKTLAAKAAVLASGQAKLAIPAVKMAAKFPSAAAMKVVPVAKVMAAKVFVPLTKAKILPASSVLKKAALKTLPKVKIAAPVLTKGIKSTVPLKAKLSVLPLVKGKIPLGKAKVAISPFTKKALALGFMKLLKAKKLVKMG